MGPPGSLAASRSYNNIKVIGIEGPLIQSHTEASLRVYFGNVFQCSSSLFWERVGSEV
jgi:hypothetical protein